MAMRRGLKQALIGLGLLVLLFGGLVGFLAYSAMGGSAPIVDGVELAPGIRVVQDGYVTIGVIDDGEGHIALIDCGNDASGKALLADLARHQLGPDAVTRIFLTHGHGDHLAACPLFPRATLMALATEVDLVEGRAKAHGPFTKLFPPNSLGLHVGQPLADDTQVMVGARRVHVYAVPGHTAGSAAYLVDGVVFLGDSGAVTKEKRIAPAPWAFTDDRPQNRASLRALGVKLQVSGEPVRTIAPAHSGVLTRPNAALALTDVQ
jgi:glyoxylase-like metal-dependent hydrolase (beta-lactamase superfamily II)